MRRVKRLWCLVAGHRPYRNRLFSDRHGICARCGYFPPSSPIGHLLNEDIRQTREAFDKVLEKIPDLPPTEGDEVPSDE